MKFVKGMNSNGLAIPAAALKVGGWDDSEASELHVMPGAIVALRGEMTAMEMIHAMESLLKLHDELLVHLCRQCGFCTGCDGGCPADLDCLTDPVTLPDDIREAAGIPEDVKLGFCVDEDEGTVTIFEADYDHNLSDVPAYLLKLLTRNGVCLGELEEFLLEDVNIYGD